MRYTFVILAVFQFLVAAARADSVEETFRRHVAAGTYAAGVVELQATAGADQARTGAAQGALQFLLAVEHLGQSLYRYGLTAPQSRDMMLFPVFRFPIPDNPHPDKIDYQALRGILESLVIDLDTAEASLSKLGDMETKLPIDLATLRIDFDADGKTGQREALAAVLTDLMGPGATGAPSDMTVNFDAADVYWLRGYGRFISSFAQFMLAHDFHETFDKTFHLMFPSAGLATGERLAANRSSAPSIDAEIGDVVAFIHLLNWPVVDSRRLSNVRERLLGTAHMSTASWAAARKESDDDLEWLPNANQKGALTGTPLTDDVIDGWLAVMAEVADVLEARKLVPHWRFDRGINAKRFFIESKRFDLVLLVAGTDAVDYLEDGPVSDSIRWWELMSTFQGNFLGYAIWFN